MTLNNATFGPTSFLFSVLQRNVCGIYTRDTFLSINLVHIKVSQTWKKYSKINKKFFFVYNIDILPQKLECKLPENCEHKIKKSLKLLVKLHCSDC